MRRRFPERFRGRSPDRAGTGIKLLAGAAAVASIGLALRRASGRSSLGPRDEQMILRGQLPDDHESLLEQFRLITASSWYDTTVRVLKNGDEIFAAMLEQIAAARSTIHFATFVYWEGEVGQRFADALSTAARSGVEVRVLLDAVGSAPMDQSLIEAMEDAGCTVVRFRDPKSHPTLANFRSHRKLLIVDGETAFTGGVGIAPEWTGDAQDEDHWRDTHVMCTGQIAAEAAAAFAEHWLEETDVLLPLNSQSANSSTDGADVRAMWLRSSPAIHATTSSLLVHFAIAGAQRRVRLCTAYFSPGDEVVNELVAAARAGVEVELLVPGPHIDSRIVRDVGRGYYPQLLEAGVTIHEFQPTMMHAKLITVDGEWCTIGSTNLDCRSAWLQDECDLLIHSPKVCATLDEHFEEDVRRSVAGKPLAPSPADYARRVAGRVFERHL